VPTNPQPPPSLAAGQMAELTSDGQHLPGFPDVMTGGANVASVDRSEACPSSPWTTLRASLCSPTVWRKE
jgi:hypothetical protein